MESVFSCSTFIKCVHAFPLAKSLQATQQMHYRVEVKLQTDQPFQLALARAAQLNFSFMGSK